MLLKDQIKTVALGLQPIVDEFVFVGGAIVECYVTRSAAEEARQTDDIDIVVELAHYGKFSALQEKLIAGGFNPDSTSSVICRYRFKLLSISCRIMKPFSDFRTGGIQMESGMRRHFP